jgi:hypothetical protein
VDSAAGAGPQPQPPFSVFTGTDPTYERPVALKARYDTDNLFHAILNIPGRQVGLLTDRPSPEGGGPHQ